MNGINLTAVLQIITGLVIAIIGFFLKDKFRKLEDADSENKCRITAIEKSFSDFKEKMPLLYTTREDHMRAQASLETRIEKVSTNMDQGFERINAKLDYKLDGFFRDFDQKINKFNEHLNDHITKKEE